MSVIVQKYGGSSLSDTKRLVAVAKRVVARHRAGSRLVVVVSAMGDTTDMLLGRAREVSAEPPRRELDMLLTVGERTTMALLCMAIHELGEHAISFTGSQCGILTTDSHSRARIMEVRPFRVRDELEKGRIVIVAGYQGTSYKREITTLGRGGSDLTAVALAAALDAEACEIYSDVDGVLTADPRVVPEAVRIEELGYEEMEELARGGARVLNRDAVAWARRTGVALYARGTFAAEAGGGTVVRSNPPRRPNAVLAVAGRKDLIVVDAAPATTGAVERALQETPVWMHTHQAGAARWILTGEDLPEADSICAAVEAAGGRVERPMGSVSIVGSGLGDDGEVRRTIGALLGARDTVLTSSAWIAVVPPDRVDPLLRDLHGALFSP